ncbi:uncharacterized protein BDV17DRAFT_21971 [Aspergillus undulatus]|uniref:uncharacterized protein n=1 Tax=Aspergillus undulatus TaxID=1810928 RepID=UPI003CCDB3F8
MASTTHTPISSTATFKARPTHKPKPTLRIETQNLTTSPAYRATKAAAPSPKPRYGDGDDDGNSTASEEEIVCALDEAALSKLPARLQLNMRKIQAERLRRVHSAHAYDHASGRTLSLRKHQRQCQHRYFDRAGTEPESIPRPKLKLKVFTESELKAQDEYKGHSSDDGYGFLKKEKLFKGDHTTIATMKEHEAKHTMQKRHDVDIGRSRDMTRYLEQKYRVPVYYSYGKREKSKRMKEEKDVDTGKTKAKSRRGVRLCGLGGTDETRLSSADTVAAEPHSPLLCLARQDGDGMSRDGCMSWRCSGPYYVHGGHAGQNSGEEFEKGNRRFLSLLSRTHYRLRMKILRAKKMFKK